MLSCKNYKSANLRCLLVNSSISKKNFFLFLPSHPHKCGSNALFIGVSVVRVSVRVSMSLSGEGKCEGLYPLQTRGYLFSNTCEIFCSLWRILTSTPNFLLRCSARCWAEYTLRCWPPVQPKENIRSVNPLCI